MNILSIVMLITSISFLYFIFRSINKNKFLLENAAVWIAVGIILVVFSMFNIIPENLSQLFGFQLTSNFLLFLAVIFLLVIVFIQSLQLSQQKNRINVIIQELSIEKSKNKSGKEVNE